MKTGRIVGVGMADPDNGQFVSLQISRQWLRGLDLNLIAAFSHCPATAQKQGCRLKKGFHSMVEPFNSRANVEQVESSSVPGPPAARSDARSLCERDVSAAAGLMRVDLETVQRMLQPDPGAMPLPVAVAVTQPGARRRIGQDQLTNLGCPR